MLWASYQQTEQGSRRFLPFCAVIGIFVLPFEEGKGKFSQIVEAGD